MNHNYIIFSTEINNLNQYNIQKELLSFQDPTILNFIMKNLNNMINHQRINRKEEFKDQSMKRDPKMLINKPKEQKKTTSKTLYSNDIIILYLLIFMRT